MCLKMGFDDDDGYDTLWIYDEVKDRIQEHRKCFDSIGSEIIDMPNSLKLYLYSVPEMKF